MAKGIPALWQRFRRPLIAVAVVGWVGFLVVMRQHYQRGASGTNKGAAELLQIGALPVT